MLTTDPQQSSPKFSFRSCTVESQEDEQQKGWVENQKKGFGVGCCQICRAQTFLRGWTRVATGKERLEPTRLNSAQSE